MGNSKSKLIDHDEVFVYKDGPQKKNKFKFPIGKFRKVKK